MSTLPPGVRIIPIEDYGCPSLLAYAGRIESRLGLPPLETGGSDIERAEASVRRANAIEGFLDLFDNPAEAEAAIRREVERSADWLCRAEEGKRWTLKQDEILYIVATRDKAFWLHFAKADTLVWEQYGGYLLNAADEFEHSFTKKELIPLIASTDPELRMLGLKLMKTRNNGLETG